MLVVPPRMTVLVCRSARDSRARASARSWPQAITFAIIESNWGGMTSPVATPVSTLMPGPDGRRQVLDQARGGREAALRVLGVEPGLDRVPAGGRLTRADVR